MSEDTRSEQPGNPYAAPSVLSTETESTDSRALSKSELEAFVGRKAGYYLRKWAPTLEGHRRETGFNWAALFLGGLWMAYRKMYTAAFVFFVVIALVSLIEDVAAVYHVADPRSLETLGRGITIAIGVICGTFGNRWYLSYVARRIAEAKAAGLQDEMLFQSLSRRGGTSFFASFEVVIILCGIIFVTSLI